MKRPALLLAAMCSLAFTLNSSAAVLYVDLNSTNPLPPYAGWSTAATNIQDAVDAANPGDQILVTNGIYQTFGHNSPDPASRVVINKTVTVQSVNGPAVTAIMGYQVPGTTNGSTAVRCVFMYDGTTLSGFTLTNGATQISGTPYGGGIYCQSANCLITNCVITGNAANVGGGATYYGTVVNCMLMGNSVSTGSSSSGGGGACHSILVNCILAGNKTGSAGGGAYICKLTNCLVCGNSVSALSVFNYGGGTYASTLVNCTVVSNSAYQGGGTFVGTLINCIVYYNTVLGYSSSNYYNGSLINCCTFPAPSSGANNFTNSPAFVNPAGGDYHLQTGSPCIDGGDNSYISNSTDLDGNPRIVNGTVDMGAYENQNTNLVHYVSLTSTNPVAPYTNWITAATNIQDAVAVAQTGEIVVAADGTYNTGSTIVYGTEANRVALTNAITLLGIYGPQSTKISGETKMRCVYVGSNAVLNGFTLAGGRASYSGGDIIKEQSGGGVWCETSGVVSNCAIGGYYWDGNLSYAMGGGIYGGTVYNSILTNNTAMYGGAAAAANLLNCVVVNNNNVEYGGYGGGIYQGPASNCTFTGNFAGNANYSGGGGGYQSTLYNCILSSNMTSGSGGGTYQCTNYNCTLANNSGTNGGGAAGGILYNCILSSNTASGAYLSTLYNCTLTGNKGGGTYSCTNYNCTLANNSGGGGGGASGGILYNCIVSSNKAALGGGTYQSINFNHWEIPRLCRGDSQSLTIPGMWVRGKDRAGLCWPMAVCAMGPLLGRL